MYTNNCIQINLNIIFKVIFIGINWMKNYETIKIVAKNNKRRIKRVMKEKDTNEKKNLIFFIIINEIYIIIIYLL